MGWKLGTHMANMLDPCAPTGECEREQIILSFTQRARRVSSGNVLTKELTRHTDGV